MNASDLQTLVECINVLCDLVLFLSGAVLSLHLWQLRV